MDEDELEELQEYYHGEYDCKVTAAREVTVEVTINLDGDKEIDALTVYAIMIADKWYIEVNESDFVAMLLYQYLY